MFELFLASKIPVIGVTTDDLPNFRVALSILANRKVQPWPTNKTSQANLGPYLYWTDDLDAVTVEVYNKLVETENQLVVINADKKSSLVMDAGVLPTPPKMIQQYLMNFLEEDGILEVMPVLKGLSLKAISEIVQITMARAGGLTPHELRRTRTMLGGVIQGLYTVDTAMDFYQKPQALEDWLELNSAYFLNPKTPAKLMPRGLMLAGKPGVGKSMGAKAIAQHFDIPLFRLDISTTLAKFVGESEARVARSLATVDRESPCVLLLDEVEKIFSGNDDQGVTQRILSQLLWWLAEHDSKVITVMTTNNLDHIPPELYRPGRIDKVIKIDLLTSAEAKLFASKVFKSVVGTEPTMKQQHTLREAIDKGKLAMSHSSVAELVYELTKQHDWFSFA